MTKSRTSTTSELAAVVHGRLIGDGSLQIDRVADLAAAGAREIAYVEDEKLFESALRSKAECVIVAQGTDLELPCRIEVRNPKLAFAQVAEVLHPPKKRTPEIHSSAVIAAEAKIG